jgi:hypothetical protein
MAIEIKELIIKMTVSEKTFDKKPSAGEINATLKNKIVKECIDKVLAKLESRTGR